MVVTFKPTTSCVNTLRHFPISRRRILRGVMLLGLTVLLVINALYGINETVRHRMLCAHVMHRGRTRHNRKLAEGCATFFPSGSGASAPWQTAFPPVTDHSVPPNESEAVPVETPKSKVAYVTTYGGCPGLDDIIEGAPGDGLNTQIGTGGSNPDGSIIATNPDGSPITTSGTNPDGTTSSIHHTADNPNFLDTAAILKHSIACTVPTIAANNEQTTAESAAIAVATSGTGSPVTTTTTTTTVSNPTTPQVDYSALLVPDGDLGEAPVMYAFIPADGITCKSDDGIEYDRALVLQNLGYHVKVWESPISPESLTRLDNIPEQITDNDLTELSKLQALKLTDHEFVVVLDQNYILKKPLDVIFDYMETTDDVAAYTLDPDTGAVDTSMLVLKPSIETYDAVLDEYYNTPFTENGWDDTGNHDLGPGGIMKLVLDNPDLPDGIELDRCIYSNNADAMCNTAPYDEVVGYNLSNDICGQPWMCEYETEQNGWSDETIAMCDTFLKHWINLRTDFANNAFNQQVTDADGDYHVEIYHGLCSAQGPANYIPILSNVPEIENCLDGSMDFHGCDPSFGSDDPGQVGQGAEIDLRVEFPQQCEVVYAPTPGINGRTEINFAGTAEIRTSGVADTSMVFVIDRSGSTCDVANLGCAADENEDFQVDDILDCEILSILGLIDKVRAEGTVSHVGLVSFSSTLRDIVPATIELPLTNIHVLDTNLVHAIENSIRAVDCGGATNYAAGIEKACEVIDSSTTEDNVVVFISDGLPTRGGAPANFCEKNAVFHTIALGVDTSCEAPGYSTSLAKVAIATDGTCQEVENVPTIKLILKEIADTKITSIIGSTHATESSVNFGCMDVPNFTSALGLNCAFLKDHCGGFLTGSTQANALGQTGDDSCCECGGGVYNDYGELDQYGSTIANINTLVAKAYQHTVIVHPGEHTVCTQAFGISAGVPGMVMKCRNILVCNNPEDF